MVLFSGYNKIWACNIICLIKLLISLCNILHRSNTIIIINMLIGYLAIECFNIWCGNIMNQYWSDTHLHVYITVSKQQFCIILQNINYQCLNVSVCLECYKDTCSNVVCIFVLVLVLTLLWFFVSFHGWPDWKCGIWFPL